MFTSLKQRAILRRTSREVYGSIVTQARHETFYRDWGVPDTMEGRVEMIILHAALVLDRLGSEGDAALALGQAVTEAYIADIDDALRQIGTGDIGVPRRVKKAAAALRERRLAYGKAPPTAAGASLRRPSPMENRPDGQTRMGHQTHLPQVLDPLLRS